MTPERWQRVRAVFDAAVEMSESKAEEYLREECAGDGELYAEVRRMLEESARSGLLDHGPAVGHTFETGAVISGRYRIVRPLGHGGMGEVYEAEDLELKEHVALKTLLPEIAADGRMIARFKQEIQLSRKIAHPNVCRVFDLARHPAEGSSAETVFYLTMEFLPGETLAARLQREGRMAGAEALPLIEQMAEALDAAHRAGIIHRDFKPSNVMLAPVIAGPRSGGLRAVITDFGLARRAAPTDETTATMSGQLIGTLDYMAPELFTGGEAAAASDIYALGLVAYKTVAGELPFESAVPLANVIRRAGQPLPPVRSRVPDLDAAWDRALACALDPDPARRFATGRQFAQALRGETASVTVKLPAMTRRRTAIAVAVVALLVAGLLGWRAWERARGRPSPESAGLYQKGVDDLHAGAYFAATKALEQAVKLAPGFCLAHARLAEAWVGLDLPEKASQEMLFARRQELSALSRLESLQVDAIDLTITREFAAAAAKYEQMLPLAGAGADDVAIDLGRAYERAGKADKAIGPYKRAAEGPGHSPAAWLHLAALYNRSGDIAKSDEAFRQAEQLYQLTSSLEGLTELDFQWGVAANRRGQLGDGAKHLQAAIDSARRAGNAQQEIRAKLQLATNAYLRGDIAAAEQHAKEALETAQANRMEYEAVGGLVTLGGAHVAKRDFEAAEREYRNALDLARRSNSPRPIALSLFSLASLHAQLRRPEETAREAEEALRFFQPNHWAQETFNCLVLLGRAQRDRGEYQAALNAFQRLFDQAKQNNDRGQQALAQESLGSVYLSQENFPEALTHYRENLILTSDPGRMGYAGLVLGDVLWYLGRYDEAGKAFDEADKRAGTSVSLQINLLRARAGMALSRQRFAEAIALAQKASAMDTGQNMVSVAELNRVLGLALMASGRTREGLQHCEQSLAAARKTGNAGVLLSAQLGLLEARIGAGDRRGSLELFQEAEPGLASHPESGWRVLSLMCRLDTGYVEKARQALGTLGRQWGDAALRTYLTRPDIQRLSRPLLKSTSASQ